MIDPTLEYVGLFAVCFFFLVLFSKRFRVLALIVLLLSGVGAGIYLYKYQDKPYGNKADLTKVYFNVSNRQFGISKAYLKDHTAWQGGDTDHINMEALLPGLRPVGTQSQAEFEKYGYGNTIGFVLHYAPQQVPLNELFALLYPKESVDAATDSQFGLKTFPFQEGPMGQDVYFRRYENGALFFVQCSQPKKEKDLLPACKGTIPLGDNFYIKFQYSRDFLKDWQSVNQELREFVAGAEEKPK